MPNINIRKFYYHLRHRYFTINNLVVAGAFVIAAGWAWGAVDVMQRNYDLARDVAYKERQAALLELEVDNLAYERNYYASAEYQELAVRERLGLGSPGEKVLVLPPNTDWAKTGRPAASQPVVREQPSNFAQWLDFLFGGAKERLK